MPLLEFSCRNFRCLAAAQLTPDPRFSLIFGANASGKTSLLEAVAYLGRGRSFRNASTDGLVRHGESSFLLHGTVGVGGAQHRVGVQNGRQGLAVSIDGDRTGGASDLAVCLPLQLIDPEVHSLVAGGPEQRRRFLDWAAFHVEQGFLERWRRYRRALKQRNAVLKTGGSDLASWDRQLVEAARPLQESRLRVAEVLIAAMAEVSGELLQDTVGFSFKRGWSEDKELASALREGRDRDRQLGSTQYGPHRADLKLSLNDRTARKLVSRGQQKLLACGMVLGATEVVQAALGRGLLLLLDDPAAELDAQSLHRLMQRVGALDCQVMATALSPDSGAFPADKAVFHVERGALRRLP